MANIYEEKCPSSHQRSSYVKDNYVLKRVHFSDDLFVLDKKWLKEFW